MIKEYRRSAADTNDLDSVGFTFAFCHLFLISASKPAHQISPGKNRILPPNECYAKPRVFLF